MLYRGNNLYGFFKDDKGNVFILVAIALVVLLGMTVFAIDVGSLYLTRRQMVNAADAAALAGAQEMILQGDVEAKVNEYATTLHNADSAEIVEQTSDTLKVRARKTADLWFYPAFASLLNSSQPTEFEVSAEAKALIYPPEDIKHLVPIATTYAAIYAAEGGTVLLTSSATWDEDMGPGNFGFVSFCSSEDGSAILGERIKYGFPGNITTDDPAYPQTGQKVGQVRPAVNWRYENAPYIVVPIIDKDSYVPGSSDTFDIVDFAAFKIDSYVFQASEHRVTGTFVDYVAVSSGGPPGDTTGTSHGVYSVTLIE